MITIHEGDSLAILKTLPDNSVDSVVTDPPYALEFMGKGWDKFTPGEFQHWCEEWARECLRVLKPGGYLLAFGGTRTWHRLAAGIEDAGFQMRDSLAWLYGSGFPKSLDVSKAIDKAAGAEREVVGPSNRHSGRTSANGAVSDLARYGQAGDVITAPATDAAKQWEGWGTALKPAFEPIVMARKPLSEKTVAANVLKHGTGGINIDACRVKTNEGRWPANVLLDEESAAELDEQSGVLRSGAKAAHHQRTTVGGNGNTHGKMAGVLGPLVDKSEGGASRFFPVFKYQAKAPAKERPKVDGVAHPTVKPLELMRWLIKLVTPPEGTVLDPFTGSGTTVEAAMMEGMSVVGIEREPEYFPLIQVRIDRAERFLIRGKNPEIQIMPNPKDDIE
jgi:DNA modification methylase